MGKVKAMTLTMLLAALLVAPMRFSAQMKLSAEQQLAHDIYNQ